MVTRYEPIEVVGPDGDDVAMEIRPDGGWVAHSEYAAYDILYPPTAPEGPL